MDIQEARQNLIDAMQHHATEIKRPVSCTDAARTYAHLREAHERLARIAAGCHAHMTDTERQYLAMTSTELLIATEQ